MFLRSASVAECSVASATSSSTLTTAGSSLSVSFCRRDRSMICCTRRVSRSLSPCMRPANRTTASGSSFASATASASRLSAPIGVLSSWLTLATKSRRMASTRCASVRSSARTTISRDVSGATRAWICVALPRRWSSRTSASRTWPSRRTWWTRVMSSSGRRSSRTRPIATAGADAWRTVSSASTITADDDRTESTASAPGGTTGVPRALGLAALAVTPQLRHQRACRGADHSGDQESCTGVHNIDRRPVHVASPSAGRLTCAFRRPFTPRSPRVASRSPRRSTVASCVTSTTNSSTRSSTTW